MSLLFDDGAVWLPIWQDPMVEPVDQRQNKLPILAGSLLLECSDMDKDLSSAA